MQNDNYVIDEGRGKTWNSPNEAADWYREQLDHAQAALEDLMETLPHLVRMAEPTCNADKKWPEKAQAYIDIYEGVKR